MMPSLWREPGDIAERNLLYGSGGAEHQPRGTMVFVDEDHAGTNPKFYVRDQEGTKWTAKMGVEAKPETAAAHLLWAVGYYTDEDYFVPRAHRRRPSSSSAAWSESRRIGWSDRECPPGASLEGPEESRQLEVEAQPFHRHPTIQRTCA